MLIFSKNYENSKFEHFANFSTKHIANFGQMNFSMRHNRGDQSWPTDTTYIRTNRLFSSAGSTTNLGRKAFRLMTDAVERPSPRSQRIDPRKDMGCNVPELRNIKKVKF